MPIKSCRECRAPENVMNFWEEYKMTQPLWKTDWSFLENVIIHQSYGIQVINQETGNTCLQKALKKKC